MYCILKLCNRFSIQNVVKARFECKLVSKLCAKEELKISVKKFTSFLKPTKNAKLFFPGSFVIASGFIKVAQSQTKKPVDLFEIVKSEDDQKPFPWQEFLRFLKRYWKWLLGVLLGTIALAFINIQIPIVLGQVVNVLVKFAGQPTADADFLKDVYKPAAKLVSLYGFQGLLTTTCISLLFNLSENLSANLKEQLFATIVFQDVAFFDKNKASDLIHRLTVDVQEFKSSFKLCISQGLRNAIQASGCVISMTMVSPKLTFYLVGLISVLIAGGTLIGSGLRMLSSQAQSQSSKSSLVAEEVLGNVRTVRAFASEELEIKNFKNESGKSTDLNKLLGLGIAVFQGLSNVALNGLVLSTLCIGGVLMSKNEIDAGSLMSFLVSSQVIQKSLNKLSATYGISIHGLNAGARVFEFMMLNPGETLKGDKFIRHHSLNCDIDFKDVTFTYPTRKDHPVLENFTLEIKGGQKVALVGPSGGGKSTVVSLLERFYDADSGSIKIDGVDLKEFDPAWLRGRLIGFIGQEPVLFATTIRENIRYGKPDATEYEIVKAAKRANAHEFIMSFPRGYDTILGERGQSISGGQKQRIAIARAFIKNPPILILDEATSALDAESERIIQESLDKISKDRTLIIVAHRLSTIKDVDIIAVIVDGKIVEIGKPEDLKKQKGVFWNLIKGQQ